jgi:glycosyltransferase involved in cell wall biosynthesis
MHILISAVSGSRSPSGICRHAANLATGLARSREVRKVTLVVGSWQREYFCQLFELNDPKLNVVSVDIRPSTLSRNVWYVFNLPQLIAQHAPDIVHLSFPIPYVRRQISPVVVSTIHDLYPYDLPEHFGRFRAFFNRSFLRVCVRNSDHLTCVSSATRSRLLQLFPSLPPTTISRIHNSVGSAFSSATVPVDSPVTTRPFMLAVAQHRKNKRLELLILAFSRLLSCGHLNHLTQLILVGNRGPETARLQRLISRLHLESNVQMLHGLSDSEMAWLYSHCLLLACPSTCEGFNLPVAEAINAGARVVCSDIPVHREIAGDACEYFTSSTPSAALELSNAILRSLNRKIPERRRVHMFSDGVLIPQYVALYRALLDTAATPCRQMQPRAATHESCAS